MMVKSLVASRIGIITSCFAYRVLTSGASFASCARPGSRIAPSAKARAMIAVRASARASTNGRCFMDPPRRCGAWLRSPLDPKNGGQWIKRHADAVIHCQRINRSPATAHAPGPPSEHVRDHGERAGAEVRFAFGQALRLSERPMGTTRVTPGDPGCGDESGPTTATAARGE